MCCKYVHNSALIILLWCILSSSFTACKKFKEGEEKPRWAKKDLSDFSDADFERLFDQWEADEEPLEEDELPEHLRPQPNIDFSRIKDSDPESLLKLSKKGRTLMTFVQVDDLFTRDETEEITKLWQTSLWNSHIQAERYLVDDNRAIFLFKDGSQAWDAKDYIIEQEGCKDVTIENKVYDGKHIKKRKDKDSVTKSKKEKVEKLNKVSRYHHTGAETMKENVHYWLYVLAFIDLFGASCVIPVFGAHLRSLGFSHSVIGLMSSVYAAIQLFSGPVVGSWSDKYGRKTVLGITLFVCSLAYFLLSVAFTFAVLLSLRIILGLMKHTQTICKALVADVIPNNKQPDIQGKLNAVAALGFMFGPVIGGHVVAEYSHGFSYICYMTSILFFLNSLLVFLLFPSVEKSTATAVEFKIYHIFADLFDVDWKRFWDVFLLKFILGICLSLFFSNYYVFVEETFNISPKYIGYTISFQGLVSAASGLLINAFNKLYAKKTLYFLKIYHCFLILSMAFVSIYFSPNIYIFILFLLPLSSSSTLIRALSTESLLERTNANHRGSLMGASNSISSSARMIAPLLTGFIQDLFNASSILIVAFILSLVGTVISAILNSSSVRKKEASKFS